MSRRSMLGAVGAVSVGAVLTPNGTAGATSSVRAAGDADLAAAIRRIMRRPEFVGARWGMSFYAPDTGEHIHTMNSDEQFVAGSSFKVFIAGTAFSALGQEHRFGTRVYRTGRVSKRVLHGDVVLVAGADLLIGGRLRSDGSLILPDPDHSYDMNPGAAAIPDSLAVLRRIAGLVADRGIRHVTGRVMVDASLFQEATADVANGNIPYTVSPMMVNDNLVDITVTPGTLVGGQAVVQLSPQTGYLRVVNQVRTIASADAASARRLELVDDAVNPDGTHTVTLVGDVPVDTAGLFRAYYVQEPVRFGAMAFTEALRACGVEVGTEPHAPSDVSALRSQYTAGNQLAEYVSPPLPDQLKVMLKASSNLHTAAWPHVVGGIAGDDPENAVTAYNEFRGRLFEDAGLDPNPPGSDDGNYTPNFFVTFLTHMMRQPYFSQYRSALPIMGRDGTLATVEVDSPAAGHVFAKTGTAMVPSGPDPAVHKALAGYIEVPGRRLVTFGAFVKVPTTTPDTAMTAAAVAGQALGEITSAVYRFLSKGR